MRLPLHLLLAGFALLIVVLGLCALLAMAERKRLRQFQARAALVVSPYVRVNQLATISRWRPTESPLVMRAVHRVGRLFGYHVERADQYPLRWWIVLGVALVLAHVVRELAVRLIGTPGQAALPIAWIMLCRAYFGGCEERHMRRLFEQFPDGLAMIVRSVRVGIPVTEAIRTMARESPQPTAEEFGKLADQVAIGVGLEQAMRDMAERNRLQEYRFFATAISLQSQTGGALTETLENLADVIRKRLALRARGHALAAEAKTTIFILAALPFVAGGGLAVIDPGYIGALFTDQVGQRLLAAAVMSLSTGIFVMRTMIRKSLS